VGRQRPSELSEQAAELRAERAALLNQTNLTFAERARAARLATRADQLTENVNETDRTARRVGVNETRLDRLRTEARNLTGPEVANIARGLAGMPEGVPGGGMGPGPDGERGPPGNVDDGERGPPEDGNTSGNAGDTERGPPADGNETGPEQGSPEDGTGADGGVDGSSGDGGADDGTGAADGADASDDGADASDDGTDDDGTDDSGSTDDDGAGGARGGSDGGPSSGER